MQIYAIKLHKIYNTFHIFVSWAYVIAKCVHLLLCAPKLIKEMVISLQRLRFFKNKCLKMFYFNNCIVMFVLFSATLFCILQKHFFF